MFINLLQSLDREMATVAAAKPILRKDEDLNLLFFQPNEKYFMAHNNG